MKGSAFDEQVLFSSIQGAGVRALLIGRRAMVALGLPVLTADYDFWVHIDDIESLNQALAVLDLVPSCGPGEARQQGRYVLENDEHIDVLVARHVATVDGVRVSFDHVWERRLLLAYDEKTAVAVPSLDDLVLTKRWAVRDRDVADIRLIEALKAGGGKP